MTESFKPDFRIIARELRRKVFSHMKEEYGGRNPGLIYVHELLAAPGPFKEYSGEPNGYMVVGQLIEDGLREVLWAQRPLPAMAILEFGFTPPRHVAEVLRGRIDVENGKTYVYISGTADIEWRGHIIELKTTRRSQVTWPWRWVAQAAMYSALYDRPVGLLIVSLLEEGWPMSLHVVEADMGFLKCWVSYWLKGFAPPYRCLDDVRVEEVGFQ